MNISGSSHPPPPPPHSPFTFYRKQANKQAECYKCISACMWYLHCLQHLANWCAGNQVWCTTIMIISRMSEKWEVRSPHVAQHFSVWGVYLRHEQKIRVHFCEKHPSMYYVIFLHYPQDIFVLIHNACRNVFEVWMKNSARAFVLDKWTWTKK